MLCGAGNMKTILVVDDEPDILELLVEILGHEGHMTVAAGDGLAALKRLMGAGIDLVITDLMMPRQDGMELIQAMRDHPRLRDVPVILMSAAERPDVDRLGSCVFLSKPFDLTELLGVVTDALS